MDYTLDGRKYAASASGNAVTIDGKVHTMEVLSSTHSGVEFLLDNAYHAVRYVDEKGGKFELEVDGVPLVLARETGLDDIVYKNSGGAGAALTESALLSQIPGKVVSVAVAPGDAVSEGETVCVLESMKMQVSVKAHSSGSVRSVRAKVGANIAKGDVIAEIE